MRLALPALVLLAGSLAAATAEDLYGTWTFAPESVDTIITAMTPPEMAQMPAEQKSMVVNMMKGQFASMRYTHDANGTTMTLPNGQKKSSKSTLTQVDATHFKAAGFDPDLKKEVVSNIEVLGKDRIKVSGFKEQMPKQQGMEKFPDAIEFVRAPAATK